MTISREAQVEHGIVAGIMMMVLEVDGQRQNQYEPKKIHITGRKDQPSLTFRIGNTLCEYLAGLGLRFQGVRLDDDGMLIMVAGHDTEKITLTKHTVRLVGRDLTPLQGFTPRWGSVGSMRVPHTQICKEKSLFLRVKRKSACLEWVMKACSGQHFMRHFCSVMPGCYVVLTQSLWC